MTCFFKNVHCTVKSRNLAPVRETYSVINWIEIYPVNSVIPVTGIGQWGEEIPGPNINPQKIQRRFSEPENCLDSKKGNSCYAQWTLWIGTHLQEMKSFFDSPQDTLRCKHSTVLWHIQREIQCNVLVFLVVLNMQNYAIGISGHFHESHNHTVLYPETRNNTEPQNTL